MQGKGRETIGLWYATAALVNPGVYWRLPVHLTRGKMSAFNSRLLLTSSLRSKHCYSPHSREEGTKMRMLMGLVLEHTANK